MHSTQVGLWKKQALENFSELFKDNGKKEKQTELNHQEQLNNLYRIIGQRDIELDWLKKN